MNEMCAVCAGTGRMATLGGGTTTCMGCGGIGWIKSSSTAPTGSVDPETTVALLSGAAAGFLAYREGSAGSDEALGIAALVALLVRFTIAAQLVWLLRVVIRLAFLAGIIAAIAHCAPHL